MLAHLLVVISYAGYGVRLRHPTEVHRPPISCSRRARWIHSDAAVNQEAIVDAIDPIEIQILQQQLQAVRNLPRITDDVMIDGNLRADALDDDPNREP